MLAQRMDQKKVTKSKVEIYIAHPASTNLGCLRLLINSMCMRIQLGLLQNLANNPGAALLRRQTAPYVEEVEEVDFGFLRLKLAKGAEGVGNGLKVGYAVALLGSQTGAGSGIFMGGSKSEEKAKSIVDFMNPLRLRILHTEEELSCLRSRFGGFIIIKVAKEWVIFEGPWIIQGHYLTVQEWTHDFDPPVSRIAKTAVWCGRYRHGKETCLSMDATNQVIGEGGDQEVEMMSLMMEQNESTRGRLKEGKIASGRRRMAKGWRLRPMLQPLGYGCTSREKTANQGNMQEDQDLLGERSRIVRRKNRDMDHILLLWWRRIFPQIPLTFQQLLH
ncbi:hypothetical protein CRG98_044938 [Punica granatum]|uniref:DUF4283 domain-containing protein n=1 Tax=Punica granatum TaxID=22663 RepID=A0A2I0HSJ6_PUNGR|nr:hypothetical protein CRG98_044938 [Punica granatum]